MSNLGTILITNKTTGEKSIGTSVKDQKPLKTSSSDQLSSSEAELPASLIDDENIESIAIPADNEIEEIGIENDKPKQKTQKPKKNLRPEIQSLAQFIEFAYSRKGQRISLPPKAEKALYKNYVIDPEMKSSLLKLAENDILLAVPRQLLLASRNILGYPQVKKELKDFIELVLKNHFIFSQNDLSAALNNLPDSPSPQQALIRVGKANMPTSEENPLTNHYKSTDQNALRANAAYCLAVWFFESKGFQIDQITQMLYTALWKPNSPESADDTTKLRTLTEIRELSGIGLACSVFKKETEKHLVIAAETIRNQEALNEKIRLLESEKNRIKHEQEEGVVKIRDLENELINERKAHALTRVHLGDDKEQLRARVLRRLKTEANLLEEGLHALRRNPPKIHVMDDHAERVLDGLYMEIKELESGD